MSDSLPADAASAAKTGVSRHYIFILVALLLVGQLVAPLIEFQFLTLLQQSYSGLEPRTQFLTKFFAIMSLVALVINLVATPIAHRRGVLAGLFVQPLVLIFLAAALLMSPTLAIAALLKIGDRSLAI